MKTGVVLLYGLFTKDQKNYKSYLDFVAGEIKKRNLQKVILCGGYTNSKKPTISEASSARDYLLTQNTTFNNYVLEDQSITTHENIKNATPDLNKDDDIALYCDTSRKSKAIWMTLHYFKKLRPEKIYKILLDFAERDMHQNFTYQNIEIIGFDVYQSKEVMQKQTYSALLDTLTLYNKNMEKMTLKQRKKDFGLS